MIRALLLKPATALMLLIVPPLVASDINGWSMGVAWADDDDDGGGGDDNDDDGGDNDDDGGSRRSSSRNDNDDDDNGRVQRIRRAPAATQQQAAPAPRRRAPPPPPPPPPPPSEAPNEIVTLALTDADLAALLDQGFVLIEERTLANFDTVSRRLRIPSGQTLVAARDAARAVPSGQDADFNHYYRSEQGFADDCRGIDCPARILLDWPVGLPRDNACGRNVPIGMIDTGINRDHETFAGAELEVVRLGSDDLVPSRALHGTAVASLLVGDPDTRSPGLIPGAKLIAVDAFSRAGRDERADVFTLLEGLDLLADAGVSIINLSLAGPPNSVLEQAVARLVNDADIALIAAVGNNGPSAGPAYPAAYPDVIAVTAVDRNRNVYRRAVTGAHVDIAAPGVDVWTAASVSGARTKTGTSFAVPFVTAATAILRQSQPDLAAVDVRDALRSRAEDIGDPGPDSVYGAGLVQLDPVCQGEFDPRVLVSE